jgi:type IV secretion system protein VirD4
MERVVPAPKPATLLAGVSPDDWTDCPQPAPVEVAEKATPAPSGSDDPVGAGHKREPELDPARPEPPKPARANEFEVDPPDEDRRQAGIRRAELDRVVRQGAIDRDDGLGM